ncbi:MAG TPA: DUF6443 domain-containing protein [Candidatus Egerieousia sp.]|nr:DUF6443 domain-containing protein [Candidatus Egerieousia sp.]
MKTFAKQYIYRAVIVVIMAFMLSPVIHAQDVSINLNLDYIDSSAGLEIDVHGGSATIHFIEYQGIQESTLREWLDQAIKEAGCESWLSYDIVNFEMQTEGDMVFTFSANDGEQVRHVTVTALTGSFVMTQSQEQSAVYTLTANKSRIAHGEDVIFTLSGSDGFAYYSLDRTLAGSTSTLATAQGTGQSLTFDVTYAKNGTYSSTAYSPVEVAMTGSPAISFYPFYGYIHSTSLSDNIITLSNNGEKKTIPFTANPSSNISDLNAILSIYNAGNSRCWNKSFQISYSSGYLTVVCPMNTGTSYTSVITDSTYFIINGSGGSLVFTQYSGGSLQHYTLSPVNVSGEKMLQLSSSQPYVTYRLYKDGQRCSNDSTMGTGETLRFSYPHTIGKYTVKAFYQGDSLVMDGGAVVVSGDRLLANDNWILKDTYTNKTGTTYVSDITYYDGLGYPEQVIQVMGSPIGRNIATPLWYDRVRREDARVYLPYMSEQTTEDKDTLPITLQKAYYQTIYGSADTAYTYTQKIYEPSPLNRVTATFNAGAVFRTADKHASYGYDANVTGEVLLLSVNSDNTLSAGGYFMCGKLYKNTVTDEDGTSMITFTNTDGKTVLQRRIISSSPVSYADTYTVYDNLQRAAWVISPEGSRLLSASTVWTENDTVAAKHCYTYIYNGKGELSEKRMPGTGRIIFIHDPGGRQVASQDSILRRDGRWLLTLYDSLSRPVKVYMTPVSITEAFLESQFATNPYPAIYSNSGNTLISEYQYGCPVDATLAFESESGFVTSEDRYRDSTGMKTYEKMLDNTTIAGTPSYVERAFYYDYKGRIIQTVEKNLNGGIDRTSFKYNFVGNILARQERISPTSGDTETVKNTLYTYDQRGRLLTETTTLDGTAQGTVNYAYDDLGKLITRTGGNGTAEQTTYNLQGWTTGMSVCTGQTNIYSQQLRYYNPQKGTPPLYTGNISEWSITQGGNPQSTFGFSYDNLNRLTGTNRYVDAGTTDVTTYTEKNLTYDANGNILTLGRYVADAGTPEDNFTYTYNGNKLMNLAGTNGGTALNGANYTYDGNGNMTHDGRMNLDVTYDLFGMPQSVQQNGTLKCAYTYLSDGTKVMVQDDSNSSLSNGYLYLGSMVFRKTGTNYAFESTDFGGGRIINVNGTLSPYYYTTDHLGSVRVITDASGNVTERNDYYAFGKRMTTGNTYPTTSSNRWKYNGKEVQTTGNVNWLDYGAREYDEVIGRWTRPDPMSEKYYGTSGYTYCVDNPIEYIDLSGMDWYEFDQNGNYQKKTEMKGTNRIVIHTVEKTKEGYKYDAYKFIAFADPKNDSKDIDNGTVNKLVFVGEEEIQSMIKEQGAVESGKLNFGWESQGGGNFDYSFKLLPEKYPNTKFDPSTGKSNSLFLPKGDNTAHNFMNFGNYLWGATGYTVGFDYADLQIGAHANSLLNSRRNGYPAQLDSKDDQLSIIKGIYHAQMHKYRNLRK